jgi:GNAT superfamily N-acetyltransferase
MAPSSALPPSRFFPAPAVPFDTEVALIAAGNVSFIEPIDPAILFVAAEDAPRDPRYAIVRSSLRIDGHDAARRIVAHLAWRSPGPAVPTQRVVVVESLEHADALWPLFEKSGMKRSSLTFFLAAAEELSQGSTLELEPMFGDDAWRAWASVEREILAEAIAPEPLSDAQLDRSVEFKRKQQRETPPIRRFVARLDGNPIAMIGYAPFGTCDLGIDAPGTLIRLRDVAVAASARRKGIGLALLRAIAARAITECGATQVLICGASEGPGAALYMRAGARRIGECTMFAGTFT